MTPEEYMDRRAMLMRQLNRIKGGEEWHRIRAKVDRLDDSFERGFYGRMWRTSRPATEQRLQAYGVTP